MSRMAEQQLYIHGGYTSATSGRTFETINPANGNVLATVQAAGREDVDRAVKSAQQGQKIWAAMTAMERSRILRRAVDILRERNDELAKLETLDTGKAYSETSTVDIVTGADVLEYYAGLIPALEGSQIPLRETSFVYTRREPLGVVAGIGAWNYPIQIALWKSAPALAAGNAMIFKPSEVTPLTALKLAEIYSEAGLPDGVFNVLPGVGAETGQYLTEHPGIAKVSFTGGVASGKKVMANSAASSLKEVTMELGGKSPVLIFEDADIERALDAALFTIFSINGERCTAGSRIFIQQSIYPEFVKRFAERANRLRVGDPNDPNTQVGALISQQHWDKVSGYIRLGIEEGATLLAGGPDKPSDLPAHLKGGNFLRPTVLADVDNRMRVAQEEIFGPVACLLPFKDEAEGLRLANDVEYGLASYIWTQDVSKVLRLARGIEAGMVFVNTQNVRDLRQPFGGVKASGTGREGGEYSFEVFAEMKNVCISMGDHPIPKWGV